MYLFYDPKGFAARTQSEKLFMFTTKSGPTKVSYKLGHRNSFPVGELNVIDIQEFGYKLIFNFSLS